MCHHSHGLEIDADNDVRCMSQTINDKHTWNGPQEECIIADFSRINVASLQEVVPSKTWFSYFVVSGLLVFVWKRVPESHFWASNKTQTIGIFC